MQVWALAWKSEVKDWLRYGEDLGLGPYYRDRAPLPQHQASPPESVLHRAVAESAPVTMTAAAQLRAASGRTPTLQAASTAKRSVSAAHCSAGASRRYRRSRVAAIVIRIHRPHRRRHALRASAKTSATARAANCTRDAPTSSTGWAIRKPSSFLWAKGRATTKTSRANPSSGAPENCSRR